ncbi:MULTISPECIES: hypothetical protein [unclassified Streptomyces]|uniref:hypothetical protein n=1 Tax=unclassified Streptomyces TaxID=2593676 RepID=UPI00338E2C8E
MVAVQDRPRAFVGIAEGTDEGLLHPRAELGHGLHQLGQVWLAASTQQAQLANEDAAGRLLGGLQEHLDRQSAQQETVENAGGQRGALQDRAGGSGGG